jgi:superoxide dismutase, Cu-Zn family
MRSLLISACVCLAFAGCSDDDNNDGHEENIGRRGDGGAPLDGSVGLDASRASDAGTDARADAAAVATLPVESTGIWYEYAADGGVSVSTELTGTAEARAEGKGMAISLAVTGLSPSREFGAHLHKLPCTEMNAGGHYQNRPGGANDPAFANPDNEVWLDFKTSATGEGRASAEVDWVPRSGEASAIVIHERTTGDGGIAGAKLFCTDIPL